MNNSTIKNLAIGLACLAPGYAIVSAVPQSVQQAERATQLNTLAECQLRYLDELSAMMQYLGQALNKGALKVSDIRQVQRWIQHNQAVIRKVQKMASLPFVEKNLYTMALVTQQIIKHISDAIERNLEQLTLADFELLPYRSPAALSLEEVSKVVTETGPLVEQLRAKTHLVGLTKVNIWARRLDSLNDKYRITKILEQVPMVGILGASALYFTPQKYINSMPLVGSILGSIKRRIGTSQFDEEEYDAQGKTIPRPRPASTTQQQQYQGTYDVALKFMQSKDVRTTLKLASGAAVWALGKEVDNPLLNIVRPLTGALKQQVSRYWDRLKGFREPEKALYDYTVELTLDDERLIGIEHQIEELRNLVRYITDPEIYDRSNSSLEKGILLVGPSRTGKTLAARALHGTINRALQAKGINARFGFREVKPGEIRWTPEGIKVLIEQAKQNAPCVLFIDELHNLPLQTKEGGETLTEFLTGMSGINSENDAKHQVILLAATNQPEMLDTALLQPGRFGTILRFEKPTYAQRKEYFEVILRRNAIDTEDIDIDALARQTEGCSYGDLESIVKYARFTARTLAQGVSQAHLQERIDKHVRRLKDDLALTDREKHLIAVHQAGHALVSLLLDPQEKLESVTLRGRWHKIKETRFWQTDQHATQVAKNTVYGALFTYNQEEQIPHLDAQEKIKQCKIKLAGALAEKLLLGSSGYTYHPKDKQKALTYAKELVLEGLDTAQLPQALQEAYTIKALDFLKQYEDETFTLLRDHKAILERVVELLKERTTLKADDIRTLMRETTQQ